MLTHSFVLDALETSGGDTFSHFEVLIEEHRRLEAEGSGRPSRLKHLVPTVGTFHTKLPLRQAFEVYNEKHKLTKRKHIQISFNEIRHIMNLAQVMAMRTFEPKDVSKEEGGAQVKDVETADRVVEDFNGPKMITFDGDQTLYSDGSNFDSNPRLANYLYELVHSGVTVRIDLKSFRRQNLDSLTLYSNQCSGGCCDCSWVRVQRRKVRISLVRSAKLLQIEELDR